MKTSLSGRRRAALGCCCACLQSHQPMLFQAPSPDVGLQQLTGSRPEHQHTSTTFSAWSLCANSSDVDHACIWPMPSGQQFALAPTRHM